MKLQQRDGIIIKFNIKQFTIKYCALKKKSRENKLKVLERKVRQAELDLISGNEFHSKREITKHLIDLQAEIDEIIAYKLKGSMTRSRRDWLQYGEKNSKMFFNLEKANYKHRNRFQIINEKGQKVNDIHEILKEQFTFFKNLYTTNSTQMPTDYLKDLKLPQVTKEDNEMLKAPISE